MTRSQDLATLKWRDCCHMEMQTIRMRLSPQPLTGEDLNNAWWVSL